MNDVSKPIEHPAVEASLRLLRHTPDRKVNLDELADNAGISKYYLTRLFKAETGTTPLQFHLEVRTSHARSLIEGGMSVAEAARRSGFIDASHLTRYFKRIYGLTPGGIKRLHPTRTGACATNRTCKWMQPTQRSRRLPLPPR